jgi:SNF2 family DNA or RNA helicase
MQLGDVVVCKGLENKGTGTIVRCHQVFGEDYVDVFFDRTTEKITVPLSSISSLKSPYDKFSSSEFSSAEQFMLRLLKDQILADISQEKIRSATNFKIMPLPHQLLAVDFVLGQFKPRALIADEVGLGKTIEAALVYEELKSRKMAKRILIVAPSGLCQQWQDEMKLKFGEDFALYDRELVHSLKKLNGQMTNVWSLHDSIITSLDFIKPKKLSDGIGERTLSNREWHNKHVYEAAAEAGFDIVIFDEAHKLTKDISGDETARYKAGKKLADAAPILLLLSATPHQGDSGKFLNLLNLIDPYLFYKGCELTPDNVRKVTVRNNKRAAVDFSGNRLFKQRLTSLCMIERDQKEDRIEMELYDAVTEYVSEYYDIASRDQNKTLMFLLLIYQRMVSSSSKAILKALTNRMNAIMDAKAGSDQTDEYNSYNNIDVEDIEDLTAEEQIDKLEKQKLSSTGTVSDELAVLKRCVSLAKEASTGRNDLKFRKLLEIINEFIIRENKPDLKFIIFTEFVETQKYISDSLNGLGYITALINGSMSAEEKLVEKRKFQKEAQFLISTDAGGEGINLQFCWVMINYDLPWNPMRLEQRIGRIDRIGQEHDVKIINFQIADTVEQRVRDIIESKLETIKQEFNDGEDKLADILSTLQEEFSFEKIYFDAVKKRELDAGQLNSIADEMYSRAKQIINSGELALPFSDFEKSSISKTELERNSQLAKYLISAYLKASNIQLEKYRTKDQVYYFEDPLTGKQMKNIIFDQKASVENEDYELLTFTHPYVIGLFHELGNALEDVTTARLQIKEAKFSGTKGFLFIYQLTITNNISIPKQFLIPIFVDMDERHNNRISQFFSDSSSIEVSNIIAGQMDLSFDGTMDVAQKACDRKAENQFYDYKFEQDKLISDMENRMKKYFHDKKESIQRIAIDNIRNSKLKELETDIIRSHDELQQKKNIVPSIECRQIAYVEFV